MVDKGIGEGGSRKRGKRREKYDDYMADRAHKAALSAAIGRRLPYHLTYSRMAAAGTLHGQGSPAGKEEEGRNEQERDQ